MRSVFIVLLIIVFSPIVGLTQGLLEADTELIDFGIVPQDSNVNRKIVIKSTGSIAVRIDSVNTYCNCITIPFDKKELVPGDSMIVFLELSSARYVGPREWQPRIYTNGTPSVLKFRLKAMIVEDIKKMPNIVALPHTLNVSQFGETAVRNASVKLINKTERHIPLKILQNDADYYRLNFPGFIEPYDTVEVILELTEDGINQEFLRTVTFEFINEKEEKKKFSIPIRRRIFTARE